VEKTLSTEEAARLPDPDKSEFLNALYEGALSCFLGQPVIADIDRIVVTVDWADGTLSLAAQPDCPRNITIALTDADNSVTGLITVIGEDPDGQAVVETMAPDGLGGGKTLTGSKVFAKVTSVVISNTGGAPTTDDEVVVGVGVKIGLPMNILAAADVRHVYLGGTRIASPNITTGASTSTVDASAGTYNGTKVLQAFVQPTRRV
jgi:hypothetical protein